MAKKTAVVELTEEQKKDRDLSQFKSFHEFIPTPTRFFNVGDKVKLGGFDTVTILERCEEGKYYYCHCISKETDLRRRSEQKSYFMWSIIFNEYKQEWDGVPKFSKEEEYHLNFMNSDIECLLSYSYNGIDMSPDYQRGNVWNVVDKTALIDSIFDNIDIGKFVIVRRPFSKGYHIGEFDHEILDGKQRLSTLFDFYEGRFLYRGYLFHELPWIDRVAFTGHSISYALVENLTQKQKYEYFLRLNVSGHAQDVSHIEYVKSLLKDATV